MNASPKVESPIWTMVMDSPRALLCEKGAPRPTAGPGQVLIQVCACGVCRTDLQILDGELLHPKLPLVLGHEIIGRVVESGEGAEKFKMGTRVGVPWLGWTCGECSYCLSERENLCEKAKFTGYTLNGGYAGYTVADERFCFPIPDAYSDTHAAPLLCAGLIGYRCLVKAGDTKRLGIYGFGAAAHIICQIARHQGREVYAFTRPGDHSAQKFALSLGAVWAGDSTTQAPELLDAAIIFASAGELVPQALKAIRPGGTVVCGGIHMSDIPSFPYQALWEERTICSVANLTRRDGEEFFKLISGMAVKTVIETYPLAKANQALIDLRTGKVQGAAVLVMS
jgi:propanol-preferring alcohol dehydrogenase